MIRSQFPAAKAPGKLRTAMRPYFPGVAASLFLAVLLLAADPAWLWLAVLPAWSAVTLAADRFREYLGWHRRGGKAALRKRRRYQGPASMSELARSFSAEGVPIGTVRSTSW